MFHVRSRSGIRRANGQFFSLCTEDKMISYNRLWETMEKRKISQYRLIKEFGLSSGQMSRLKKNTYVSTHTLETLCRILDCRIEDVMEVSFEDEEKENKAN